MVLLVNSAEKMRKWLVLISLPILLLTSCSRLVAAQERGLALRQAIVASLKRDDAQAEVVWEQVCDAGRIGQSELSCLWLYLSTEGERGCVPWSSLDSDTIAGYAYEFGWWAEESEALERAIFSYYLSLDFAPNRHVANRLTRLLLQDGREAEALAAWRQVAAALPSGNADHWWALAQAAMLEEDWERAAGALGQGGELAEEPYPYFWMEQGGVFGRLRDWGRARAAYWRAFVTAPLHPAPSRAMGGTYLQQERFAYAVQWVWMSVQLNPDDPLSYYAMAQLLHKAGEVEEAVTFLAQAVELHPRRLWRWAVDLGDWRLELGDREGALEAYRQALTWQPGEAFIEERVEQVLEME